MPMHRLPDGRTVSVLPEPYKDKSPEALVALGVKKFSEMPFDKKYRVSTGWEETEAGGLITRTHTTDARYTVEELQGFRIPALIDQVNKAATGAMKSTNWLPNRDAEERALGLPLSGIPDVVATFRSDIRTKHNDNRLAILALDDYDDLAGGFRPAPMPSSNDRIEEEGVPFEEQALVYPGLKDYER